MSAFRKEPTVIIAIIEAVIAAAVVFGLDLTVEQIAAVMGVVLAVGAVWTRQSVYAPDTVEDIKDAQ